MIKNTIYIISVVLLVGVQFAHADPDGYLRKGTYALDPDNRRDIFLYIPGKTLLYSIKSERIRIGSRAFVNQQKTYIQARTQAGIDVLVWEDEVKTNMDNLSRFDFFVNRRLPLCLNLASCDSIWSKFGRVSDEGVGWLAIWPGAGGKLYENTSGNQRVKIDAGGWEEGFIPLKRQGLTIEDYGYITNLKRAYPLYRFSKKGLDGLSTTCGETLTNNKSNELYTKIEAYGKLSAKMTADPTYAMSSLIPKK